MRTSNPSARPCSSAFPAALIAAALSLAAAGPGARAGVDAELGPKASVRGTIAPSGETEVFRFTAPAQATVTITATSKQKRALDLALALDAPSGDPVPLEGARRFRDTGGKVTVQGLALPASGVYTLRLSAAGTGEYTLALSVAPRTKFAQRDLVAAGGTAQVPFSAPAGARLSLLAKASKKSPAQPRFGKLGGVDLSGEGKIRKTSHAVSVAAVATTGDYEVAVTNAGAAEGSVDTTVAVRPAKAKTRKLDVRGVDGAGAAVMRVVAAEGGGTIEVEGASSPLGGCVLTVPPGALGADTTITVLSNRPLPVPDPATQRIAGPVATFGPAGTTFATPVTIRLPYDPWAFPQGSDPATDLRVVRREADGTTTTLVPTAVVPAEAMYEFETTGFSDFFPVAPPGAATLDGRTYWTLRLAQAHENSPSDTRRREVRVRTGVSTLVADRTFSLAGVERTVVVDTAGAAADAVQGSVDVSDAPAAASGAWQYVTGEPSLTKVTIGPDKLSMRDDGAVLCGSLREGSDVAPDLHVWAQKPAFPPTAGDLLGTYHLGRVSIVPTAASGGPAEVVYTVAFGTLELRTGGACRWVRDEVTWHHDVVTGEQVESANRKTYSGTFAVAGPSAGVFEGAVDVQVAGLAWRLLPDRTAEVLIGTDAAPADATASVLVATRASADLPLSAMDGTFAAYGLAAVPETYRIDGRVVPDWSSINSYETRWWRGSLGFEFTPHAIYQIERSEWGGVSVTGGLSTRVEDATVAYASTGRYQILTLTTGDSPDLIGGIAPGASFGFAVRNPEWARDTMVQVFVRTGP